MPIRGKEGFLAYDGKEVDESKEGEGEEGDGEEGDVLQLGWARTALSQGRHKSSASDPSLRKHQISAFKACTTAEE